ncbi:MAG: hypothetical protein GY928_02260 [Colwellia sp.]|nr:hypothetical protein [Colwellia sp.]
MAELIKDKRLTTTMTRVRSGKTQVFTEKGNDSIRIELEHEKDSMYAELIDGQWYWLEGCAECKGEPRDWMTYIECDKHNVCSSCSRSRSEAPQPHWGGKTGWTCKTCKESMIADARSLAFEEFNSKEYDEYDFSYNNEIKCPHCGTEISNNEIYESQDSECGLCEGELSIEVYHQLTYSTSVKGKRITQ